MGSACKCHWACCELCVLWTGSKQGGTTSTRNGFSKRSRPPFCRASKRGCGAARGRRKAACGRAKGCRGAACGGGTACRGTAKAGCGAPCSGGKACYHSHWVEFYS